MRYALEEGLVRKAPNANAETVSTIRFGETYQVLEERRGDKKAWVRLAIPTLEHAWISAGVVTNVAASGISVIERYLEITAAMLKTRSSLIVIVKADAPPEVFPVDLFLLRGPMADVRTLLGTLARPEERTFPLSRELTHEGRLIVLANGKNALSHRQWVELRPAVASMPDTLTATVETTPYNRGETEFTFHVLAPDVITQVTYEGPDFLALVTPRAAVSGDVELRFRLNLDAWRMRGPRTQPVPGKLVFVFQDGQSGERPVQVAVRETWSALAWLRFEALPWVLVFVLGASVAAVCVVVALQIGNLWSSGNTRKPGGLNHGRTLPRTKLEGGFVDTDQLSNLQANLSQLLSSQGQLSQLARSLESTLAALRRSESETMTKLQAIDVVVSELKGERTREMERLGGERDSLIKKVRELEALTVTLHADLERSKRRIQDVDGKVSEAQAAYDEEVSRLKSELSRRDEKITSLAEKCRTMESSFVFVHAGPHPLLESMKSDIREFSEQVVELQRLFQSVEFGSATANDKMRQLTGAVNQIGLDWISRCLVNIDELIQYGRSTFPSLLAKIGGGQVATETDCGRYIQEIVFQNVIQNRWDHVLRAFQLVYNMRHIVELSPPDLAQWQRTVELVRTHQRRASQALTRLGITPLPIVFLEGVGNTLIAYVSYAREERVEKFYPLWSGEQRRGLVLDVTTWGYLTDDRKLWASQKAELVITR